MDERPGQPAAGPPPAGAPPVPSTPPTADPADEPREAQRAGGRRPLSLLLLLVPFVALLWVPFYASVTPRLDGIPFFVWYQFLWIVISSAITIVVYLLQRERGEVSK